MPSRESAAELLTKDEPLRRQRRSCRNCRVEADTRADSGVRRRKCYKITKIAILYENKQHIVAKR